MLNAENVVNSLHVQDFVKSYKRFFTSYYVSDGIRITLAIMLPILVFSMMGDIQAGVTCSLGVLCVCICDSPGPLHHRVNGMMLSIALIFIMTLLTGLSIPYHTVMAIEVLLFGFLFSMIGVYGARANSVGIAALLVMILHIDELYTPQLILKNSFYVLAGGSWYFLLSLAVNRLRPYKLAQQVIGDAILSTASYIRFKALMYDKATDYDKNYKELINKQASLHAKQDLAREILFKTRTLVKDTTLKGRVLLAVFIESVDLFEQVMASHVNYKSLHQLVDEKLLIKFSTVIHTIANDLDSVGIAMQSGIRSTSNKLVQQQIQLLEQEFDIYFSTHSNDQNKEVLLNLKQVIASLQAIHNRILLMHQYTAYDPELNVTTSEAVDHKKFITSTVISLETFFSNLNLQSNIFRYSLRVGITLFVGYLLLQFLPFGHNYWILLTILVILKPAYSLTKERNIQRLTGTIVGIIAGTVILYIVKNENALLVMMIVSMVLAFSLMRLSYFPFVVFMTIYLLLSFHLLKTEDFDAIISDRIIDTIIGSVLGFLATLIIPPKWEREQIATLVEKTLQSNGYYFLYVANSFISNEMNVGEYKLYRKEAYVALANLSGAFQRMLSEPDNKQIKGTDMYGMVTNNHLLLSHTSTLALYLPLLKIKINAPQYNLLIENTVQCIQDSRPKNSLLPLSLAESIKEIERNVVLAFKGEEEEKKQQKIILEAVMDQVQYIYHIATDIQRLHSKNASVVQ